MPGSFQFEKNRLQSVATWVELWTVDLDGTNGLFLTPASSPITFNGRTYSRAAIKRDAMSKDTRGSIPTTRVSIGNVDGQAVLIAGQYRLSGRPVTVQLVNTSLIGTSTAVITERFSILESEASDLWLVVTLGLQSPMDLPFPRRRYQRNRCDNVYGDDLCGYNTARSGALVACDLTFDKANGCKIHGDDEVAAGLPRQHTHNFGGCPGIAKGPFQ